MDYNTYEWLTEMGFVLDEPDDKEKEAEPAFCLETSNKAGVKMQT